MKTRNVVRARSRHRHKSQSKTFHLLRANEIRRKKLWGDPRSAKTQCSCHLHRHNERGVYFVLGHERNSSCSAPLSHYVLRVRVSQTADYNLRKMNYSLSRFIFTFTTRKLYGKLLAVSWIHHFLRNMSCLHMVGFIWSISVHHNNNLTSRFK